MAEEFQLEFILKKISLVFSNDGKKLAFSSNRNNGDTRDTNLFIAEWID